MKDKLTIEGVNEEFGTKLSQFSSEGGFLKDDGVDFGLVALWQKEILQTLVEQTREDEREKFNSQIYILPVEKGTALAFAGKLHAGIKILGSDLVSTEHPDALMYGEKPLREALSPKEDNC